MKMIKKTTCSYDYEFLRQLRDCYFAPGRAGEYPSPELEAVALAAMILLWNKPAIYLLGKTYTMPMIRDTLLFHMTPYHLDRALEIFIHSEEQRSLNQLAELIFWTALYDDTLTTVQFLRDYGGAE